ncbi:MAG TPA: efflux RND transporter periplasmic adaptor subunit [Myxococcota bacterium]|nr:efflux RND transporter periplasmic adaptor subunit [Myxococcota bacterium]HOH76626.1 efflux RND transporter periplasmic adaptor subunit [Myxococcota bacterium]HPV03675.1 efflux RND transporter periplasmic adaptor subunit [Myxococcota bacterium]
MKKGTRFVVIPVVAAVVAAIVILLVFKGRDDAAGKPVWQTTKVHRGDVAYKVTASGTLSPLVTVNVGSQVSGRLQEILVDFNSPVKAGQLIAVIDPSITELEVQRARASVQTARAGIAKASAVVSDRKQVSDRTSVLRDRRLATDMEADSAAAALESARAELLSARAQLAQAQAMLKQAQTNLGYTKIVSPIDGVVISRQIDVGQTVAASFQAPVLFQIAGDLRKMEVHTSLAESDVGQVHDGMPVEFTVDAFPSRVFKGEVKQVRYSPTTVQNVVTYDAVVSVDNEDLQLRPGMTADVSFIVSKSTNALVVSNTALRFKPPSVAEPDPKSPPRQSGGSLFGFMPRPMQQKPSETDETEMAKKTAGRRTVWVPGPAGDAVQVAIEAGITDGRITEVLSGLKEDDLVITGVESGASGAAKGQPGSGRM